MLSTVATKDTITELNLGLKDLGDKLLVVATVTAAGEQVSLNLPCKKPADWDGQPVTIGVKSQTFSAVVTSLLKFKEDIYIDITGNVVKAGVEKKAEVTLDTVAELPQKIEGGETILQFVMKDADLQSFIRKGLTTGAQEARDDGTSNAVLTIDMSDGEARGTMVGFSTTRYITSLGRGKALLPKAPEGNEAAAKQIEAMEQAFDAYCAKTGQDKSALAIVMPVVSIKHLQTLAQGQAQVLFAVTEKYVNVSLGNVGVYTFRQGAKAPAKAQQMEAIVGQATQGAIKVGFDAAAIGNAVSFINDMDKLDGTLGKKAVHLTVSGDGLMIISGNNDKAETSVKVLNGGGDADMYVNGQLLKEALAVLDKGNVVVSFGAGLLLLQNGTVTEGVSNTALAFIMAVKPAVEEPAEETESDEAETSDETADAAE